MGKLKSIKSLNITGQDKAQFNNGDIVCFDKPFDIHGAGDVRIFIVEDKEKGWYKGLNGIPYVLDIRCFRAPYKVLTAGRKV